MENTGLFIKNRDERLEVLPVLDGIMRVRYSVNEFSKEPSLMIDEEGLPPFRGEVRDAVSFPGSETAVSAGRLKASVCGESLRLKWMSAEGELLLSEGRKEFTRVPVMAYTTGDEEPVIERVKTVDGERNFIKNLREVKDHEALQGRLYFEFSEDEQIHGFGQAEEGIYNYRYHVQYLYQHNMRIPMPVMISDRGYGILFDITSLMTFNDTENGSYIFFDAIPQLTYYFIYGPGMDEIVKGIRRLTGEAAMLPKWAFGYIQSKEQYYSAKELYETAKRYRDLNIPIDCIVQDWNTWEKDKWGNKLLDNERYGDIEEQSRRLHDINVHTMVSVWPNMNFGTENHTEFSEKGYLLNDLATYDAFNEEARRIYWRQAKEGLFDRGFDSFWCDSTEPFSGPDWGGEIKREPWKRYELVGGEHKKYLPPEKANAYALMHAKGIYENQRRTDGDKRVLNLTRSGYASGQRYGAMLWSGDTCASWQTLRRQITEGLNMGLSGYPYWTLDIGGFFTVGKKWQNRGCGCNNDPSPKWFWRGEYDEGVKDRGYCELYVRWLQFGTFLPMFRSHGTDTPREIWNFGREGEPFYDAIADSIRLRYRLMPYIYSLAGSVRLHSDTIMRSLIFDFPEDIAARHIDFEFMFGRSLLVCPITEPMYFTAGDKPLKEGDRTWDVYFPGEGIWYDLYTDSKYRGGQAVKIRTGLSHIPVFVRAGSIIPMREGLSYASEEPDTPLELHVYAGADGRFTLYEDAGDGYGYEKGEYSLISLEYSDKDRILDIAERKGAFPGMQTEKRLLVILHGASLKEAGGEAGESETGQVRRELVYSGEAVRTELIPENAFNCRLK
ncbi:MAG TPA: glycoside hydrolase [Lachnospiraceae bacterium]|nr:glycoside hydrolase [Lachnospiraceae bacterium]